MRNILLLAILIAVAFSPCLKAGFVYWDDDHHLLDNPQVKTLSLSNTLSIFQSVVNKTYIPLTTLTFNIEHFFFGLNPFVYHLNNLLLHILVCLLIYRLSLIMGLHSSNAFFAGLLFGIHPMHVESVAWVTERKDVLYSFFYVAGLLAYCRYIRTSSRTSWLLSIVAGFLSLLAKPMALSYPLALLLLDWYLRRSWNIRLLFEKAPFVLFIPIIWLTYSLNIKPNTHPPMESALIWIWSFTFYLKKFFLPMPLIPAYPLPYPISLANPEYLGAILIAVIAIALVWLFRKDRLVLFAAAYYLLSIFFLLRTFDVTKNLGPSIVADRFMYLPSLGICLWLGVIASRQLSTHRAFSIIFVNILIAVLMVQTFLQCRIWQNDYALWGHQLQYEQRSPLAFNSYAVALMKKQDHHGALEALDKAIALKPDYARAYYNRGFIYAQLGKTSRALEDLSSAISLDPLHFGAFLARGTTLARTGNHPQAIADLTRAVELEPNNFEAFNNRGIVYKKLGRWEEAIIDYDRALKLNPRSGSTLINRAAVWKELREWEKAEQDLIEAQRLKDRINH